MPRNRGSTSASGSGVRWEARHPQGSGAYAMRMARVNLTIPDELLAQARAAGLNVSRVSALALSAELDRQAKIAALEGMLRDLDAAHGPVSPGEAQEAREWADRVQGRLREVGSGTRARPA